MKIVRFMDGNECALGIVNEDSTTVTNITAIDSTLTNVVTLFSNAKEKGVGPSNLITELLQDREDLKVHKISEITLLTPVNAPEVWCAGVTYQDSRRARNTETSQKDDVTFYDKVYAADRPELFLKSTDRRTKAPEEVLFLRTDSNWLVPEPEICLVVTSDKELIGYTIGNDLSSRDIEGENPLYLPQAKIWEGSCSFGPAILLVDSVDNPYDLDIICRIYRNDEKVFEGSANTKQLNRSFDELMNYLFKDNVIFDGTVLMTGTCIVPPDHFTLEDGDTVEIEIPSIGKLVNPIRRR